jgi:hypothetical protein
LTARLAVARGALVCSGNDPGGERCQWPTARLAATVATLGCMLIAPLGLQLFSVRCTCCCALGLAAPAAPDGVALHAHALGLAPGFADLAIAGIAQAHGLIVLTRNLRHFAPLGIAASDPFAARPE